MPVTIRLYQPEDAERITALYNRHPDNPNPVAGGITAEDFERELADRRTAAFFVAVDGEQVVGTFGLFQVTGRRSARAGELIADMLFIVPSHRNGMLTGQIFARAVTWMFQELYLVLRLTVNPANKAAFRLYRRVGCVSVGAAEPGEDGNVELYNYIPLILRSVLLDLGPEGRAALRSLTSYACLTGDRGEDLGSDLDVVAGVRTTPYRLALNGLVLDATVNVDDGTVTEASFTGGDGTTRALAITPREPDRARPDTRTYRFGTADLTCEVDGADGTVRLVTPYHLGPVLTSSWPTVHPDRVPGWRDPSPCDLHVTPVRDGVRITERHGDAELTGTVTLVDGRLRQDFTSTVPVGRVFSVVGVRQAAVALPDGSTHPVGLGLGVRDSSEIVAAAHRPARGGMLTWTSADGAVEVSVPVRGATRLVHSRLLDRRPAGAGRRLRLDAHVRVTAPPPSVVAGPSPTSDGGPHQIRMSAAAGGVTAWTAGRTRVLRSAYPHRRVLVCNPTWSAGMWVTTERPRESRDSGLGWGFAQGTWEPKHPLGISDPDRRISWEVIPGETSVTVDVHHPDATGDVVLWLTPRTGRGARVVVPAPDGTWELNTDTPWQRWTAHASIELTDGRLLTCRPGAGAPDDAEILVRSTAAGLLVGCVTRAGTASTWNFSVTP